MRFFIYVITKLRESNRSEASLAEGQQAEA